MERNLQNDLVYPGERVDDLQNGMYVIQNPEKFCFGMDAVLLSGFADIRRNEKVLDMGTGTGIIPILLKSKDKGEHLTGLEIQEECAEMARRSVLYNHLEADIDIVCGDIKEAAGIFGAASFHAVTCNPPYMIGQHGLQNPYMAKAIARHEVLCTLEDVVSQEREKLQSELQEDQESILAKAKENEMKVWILDDSHFPTGYANGKVKECYPQYLKKYLEPSPAMLPFNILSELTSTGAMAVRLFGNVLSGVIIGTICMMLVPFILPLPMQVLGLFTGMIQAYIFAMLALMYVSSVQSEEDEAIGNDVAKSNETL